MTTLLIHEPLRGQFKELIKQTCGFSFAADREATLLKALKQRMQTCKTTSPDLYYTLLLGNKDELHQLAELLTVNETYFFREPDHLKLIVETLIPELQITRPTGPIRILSAGCSSGEEAYSVAMLLQERHTDSAQLFNITGIDIDTGAIAAARKAVYGKPSFRGTAPFTTERYLEPVENGLFQISETIRRQVSFEPINLLGEESIARIPAQDIILYRNVSIYFPQDVQKKIFSRLADLLNPGGYLIVGASETLHHDLGILALVERNSLFIYNKPAEFKIEDRRSSRRHAAPAARPAARPGTVQDTRISPSKPPASQPKHDPTNTDVREQFDLALDKAHNHQYEEALEILEAIISQDRSFAEAYSLKACLLLNLARHTDAQHASTALLELKPFCREAYLILGIIARHHGDDSEAFKRFREALYLDSTCWLAHFYTAEIMFARQESRRARSSYETALNILESNQNPKLGQAFFPLSINAGQYLSICRHKLSLLKENR